MIETNRVGFRKQLTGPYPHSKRLKPCMLVFFACCLLWPLSGTFVLLTATASAADSPQVSETATSVRYSLPEDVPRKPFSFAGEIVPFQRSDVRYRVGSQINFLLLDARSVLIEWLIRRDVPVQLIQQILEKEGVPPEFVFFCPVLAGLTRNDQKASGAGIWHISKPCDKADGVEMQEDSWHDDRMDIELATHCFASRIKSLRSQIRGGSWIMAAAAYVTSPNTGSDAQGNWDATSFWDVPLPPNIEQLICRWIAFTIIHGHERFYHI
ncbi:MAG: rane-bound lytic murein transglycosylase, partial [Thermodesulfobacteriota bacterium]|nr:rane-bound lytic murein transglycosylase [Thermodesulfobacteriota bacterium]